ncbi:hypothetical protein Gohar_024909 [Gossypium harknessii]|uniref:RNase H type-1 domain-containing protein n=1 Tax=Gossypium harknessii TaxID=34285 RepID=A0A7J9HHC7_9ROSI|nr:hypothetical protein [Gossypium harknessii]
MGVFAAANASGDRDGVTRGHGRAGFIYAHFSPSIAEAFSIRETLSWLKYLAFDNLCDCLLMKNEFQHLSFYWTHGCANEAAHSLAQAPLLYANHMEWDGFPIISFNENVLYVIVNSVVGKCG